jgi:hypothetical protein
VEPIADREDPRQAVFHLPNGLLSSAGYNPEDEEPLYTVGTNAYRVEGVVTVRALMDELRGAASTADVADVRCATES